MHKKDIVQEQNGYLVFYSSDALQDIAFFPFKDTLDTKFLSQSHFNGYRIWDENLQNEIMYLKDRAFNYAYQPQYQNKSHPLTADTLSIIPVRIRFYLGDSWSSTKYGEDKSEIAYEFEDKKYELHFSVHDYRYILLVSVSRESDVKWLNQNYQRYIPSR